MINFNAILLDPDSGLIPSIERELTIDIGRFQIRSWSFSGLNEGCGYRIRNISAAPSREQTSTKVEADVLIGYLLEVENERDCQVLAVEKAQEIYNIIFHWSICNEHIDSIDGFNVSISMRNENAISSKRAKAWYAVIVIEFAISTEY